MPGFLLHQGALVLCAHLGQAQPVMVNPRVRVERQALVTLSSSYAIAGCVPPPSTSPCATARWITAATRVRAGGEPVLLQDSQAICAPTGVPLNVLMTQMRVRGI